MTRPLVAYGDRLRCFLTGHDVRSWGTICGHCRRCHHSVWTYDGKSVLLGGEFHRFPPPHSDDDERRLVALGYTPGGVPDRSAAERELEELGGFKLPKLPDLSREEANALRGSEDLYLRGLEGER
jgi:hypothetical protein